MQRRKLLGFVGVAGSVALAGCSTITGGGTENGGSSQGEPDLEWSSDNGLQITISDYAFSDSIYLNESRLDPDNEGQFLFINVEVRNNGDEEVRSPQRGDFIIEDADEIRFDQIEYPTSADPGSLTQPLTGDIYTSDDSLSVGGSAGGFIIFELEDEVSSPTLVIPSLEDTADTTPSWSLAANSQAQISFDVSLSGPDGAITQFQPQTYTVSIENSGGHQGRFERTLSINGGSFEQEQEETNREENSTRTIETGLDGGETFTEEISIIPREIDSLVVSFNPEEIESVIQPPAFGFGETYAAPSGLEYTVEDVQFTEEVRDERADSEDIVTTTDSDTKIALFYAKAINSSDEAAGLPRVFTIYTTNTPTTGEHDVRISGYAEGILDDFSDEIDSPVSGSEYFADTLDYESGDGAEGWLAGLVDQNVTRDELIIYADNRDLDDIEMVMWNDGGNQPEI